MQPSDARVEGTPAIDKSLRNGFVSVRPETLGQLGRKQAELHTEQIAAKPPAGAGLTERGGHR